MPTLTICRGISGSGKSTWARQQNAVVTSRDDIRDMLFPTHKTDPAIYYRLDKDVLADAEHQVTLVQEAIIAGLLKAGKNVIVDNTNIQFKFVKQIAKIGYRYGADVEVKVFDVPLAQAIHQDYTRHLSGGRGVGKDIITKQYESFKHSKKMTLEPVTYPEPYSGTPGKPKAFMFDLDGTTYHMNNKRGPYDHNVDVDDPDEVIIELINAITTVTGWHPIAMSGRKEATREKTEACLERDYVMYDALFMRADDDNRADNLVKGDLFDENVRENYDVQFVFDDRDQVVETWRRIGIKCLQVAEGDF